MIRIIFYSHVKNPLGKSLTESSLNKRDIHIVDYLVWLKFLYVDSR